MLLMHSNWLEWRFGQALERRFSAFATKSRNASHLVKTSTTNNKYLTPQFSEDNDPISAKSATESYL